MELLLSALRWSAVVGAATLLLVCLRGALEKRYRPRWRYWVWLVLAVLLLQAPVPWQSLQPGGAAGFQPPVVVEVPQVHVPLGGGQIQPPAAAGDAQPADRVDIALGRVPSRAELEQAYQAGGLSISLEAILVPLWLAGCVLFLLWHLVGTMWYCRRLRRWGRRCENTMILAVLEQERTAMGLTRSLPVFCSSQAASPLVAGLFFPQLFLPGEDYNEETLRFILRHELTHVKRRDLFYQLLLLLANALHWFNPLIYLLRRQAGADLELICDETVMAAGSAQERRAYSETLLSSLHRQSGLSRIALSTHFCGGAAVMKARLRNILGSRARKWGALALALVLLVTLATACAFSLRQAQEDSPQGDSTPAEDPNPAEDPTPAEDPVPSGPPEDGDALAPSTDLDAFLQTTAWRLIDEEIAYLESSALKPVIQEKRIESLTCQGTCPVGEKTYSVWELTYRLLPDDISKVQFAGGMSEEDGWVTEASSMGSPLLIVSQDGEGLVRLEEINYTGSMGESGYSLEEYITCGLSLRMRLPGKLAGWPDICTPFILERLAGKNAWTEDWEQTAKLYLGEQGYEASDLTILTRFDPSGDSDESLLVQAQCPAGTIRLLLCYILYNTGYHGSTSFWQVNAALLPDGSSPEPVWDELLLKETFALSAEESATIYLYGRAMDYGSYGINKVEVFYPGGNGGTAFYPREAIVSTWGEDSLDYYTEAWESDGGLVLTDINLDGYTDIGLQAWITAYNMPYYYWLYQPDTREFTYAGQLPCPLGIGTDGEIICAYRSGADTYITDFYQWVDGQLALVRQEIE